MKNPFVEQSFMQNPESVLGPLREKSSVARVKLPIIGQVWMTTTAQATSAMLKDNECFTMRKTDSSRGRQVAGVQWWMPRSIQLLANNMLTHDEPDHRRLRKLVDQAFQRRSVLALKTQTETIAQSFVANIVREAQEKGSGELVAGFARPFPMAVICELLGMPHALKQEFSQQAARMSTMSGIVSFLSALMPIRKMRAMVSEVIKDTQNRVKNGEPTEGLIAELVQAEADGERLSHDELIAMVFLLLIAGHETTSHLISGSVVALLENPDQQRWLFEKPEHMDLAVEELLRFVSPVQFSKPRHVQQNKTFYGAELKKGDLIMAGLAAANYDPAEFDEPDQLNLTRRPNPHMEFGTGIHFCLGFQLARLELKIALQVLFSNLPEMQMGTDGPKWGQRMGLRVVERLPILVK